MRLGFSDGVTFQGGIDSAQRDVALSHARAAGASMIRLRVAWNRVDPDQPPSSREARDPSWSGYRWGPVDSEVRAVVAAGLQPLIVADGLQGVPLFFEGPNRPAPDDFARYGTWRPSTVAFRDFAHALALRYGGRWPDRPGAHLPRVRYFQAGNEPNLPEYLSPQWVGTTAESPNVYRGLLNAFYDGVKGVHRDNVVVSGAVAPYGDPPIGRRIQPLYFARRLLCVDGDLHLRARRCPRLKFDAFAYNAYPFEDPRLPPAFADDVRVRADDIQRVLRSAAAAGTISRRQAGNVWLTELGWDVLPAVEPQPHTAVTPEDQARYLAIALRLLWRDHVRAVFWFNLRDYRTVSAFTTSSGLFRWAPDVHADEPKPAYTAFRFPLTAFNSGSRTAIWGRAPTRGLVIVQRRYSSGQWRRVTVLRVGRSHVFSGTARIPVGAELRAVRGHDTSLTWRVQPL